MKILNKRNIIILVIIIAVLGLVFWKSSGSKTKEITTAKVIRGNLIQSIEPSGSVKSKTEINLNFDTTGRIAEMKVKVGDEVKAGQLLASLEVGNLTAAVKQAEADLSKARGNLNSYEAGSTPEIIAQYEAEVQKAQANLDNIKASLKQTLGNTYINQINTLQGSVSPMETAMTDLDSILGVENASANDDFDKALVTLDNSSFYYSQAKTDFNKARTQLNEAKLIVQTLSVKTSTTIIDESNLKTKNALSAVADALSSAWTVLDKLDVTSPTNNLSIATVSAKKTTIDTDRTTITTKKTSVLTGEQAIATAKLNYQAEDAGGQYEANVKVYEAALASAQAVLAAKKALPRQVDLESYRAAVKAAEAALLAAQANYNKAFIHAPVPGVITKKNNEVGESNSAATPVLVMLANSDYEIEVNVSEADIAKVQVGQKTDITLDAFGDDHIFKGQVTMIDPAETLISDVVYYKVKVSIDRESSLKDGQNITEDHLKDIKAGMTASVMIFTNYKKDVLMIPERAVLIKENKKYIRVLIDKKNQTIIEKEVGVGLRGNGGMIEIISGLNEGEEAVTFIKNGN